jgi:DNA uptake protein ComE-like DNA-binding protein
MSSGSMNKTVKSVPSTMSAPKTFVKSTPVSVNKGTDSDLQKVKGIGLATAKKIISNRPYRS